MNRQDIIVVGGGIIGVTTAYELAHRGHRTTLLEARDGIALETTYANGAGGLTEIDPELYRATR
jgi:glycine/D-amino acid oxidase-like deaminating enzyme